MTERGGPPARALRARTLEPPVTRTPAARAFVDRHIGPRPDDVARMLDRIGAPSLDALIDQAVPATIRTARPLDLPPARSEAEVLAALHASADPAQRAGEPRLVHVVHAVPARDQPGPAGGAARFPDRDRRPDGAADRRRLPAGRGDRGHRGRAADAASREGTRGWRGRRGRRVPAADTRGAAGPGRRDRPAPRGRGPDRRAAH